MSDKEIKDLLNSDDLSIVEHEITDGCKTYVNKEFIDQSIGILRRVISNSGLTLADIYHLLSTKRETLVKFGIKLYKTLKRSPIDEEYPKGEEIPKSLRSKVIASHGLGIGFSVKYAIYLHFLETDLTRLSEYLKKERIPKSEIFSKSLIRIYNS
jgi:hypothetical protein